MSTGDLVGLVDDDEEIDAGWYRCVLDAFRDPQIDFIGGPYLPVWEAPPPEWLPPRSKGGIIGCVQLSSTPREYADMPGSSMGSGNAVMRRSLLERAGPYRTDIGSHHDADMFNRFMAMGARGVYLPGLMIYHHIPAARLTKKYFRKWMWRSGMCYAQFEDWDGARSVAGVPLFLCREFLTASFALLKSAILLSPASIRFQNELDAISAAASAYGRLRFRPALPR